MLQHHPLNFQLFSFHRYFNKTRVYETCLRTYPRFYAFSLFFGIFGGYGFTQMTEWTWKWWNKGRLYADLPYVYPKWEED